VILRGGTLVDGAGRPRYRADVAVRVPRGVRVNWGDPGSPAPPFQSLPGALRTRRPGQGQIAVARMAIRGRIAKLKAIEHERWGYARAVIEAEVTKVEEDRAPVLRSWRGRLRAVLMARVWSEPAP
jgi:hypothetical protein